MNDITLLREAGPEAAPLHPEVRSSARAALLAEIEGIGARAPRRLRLPSRKTGVRIAAGVAVAATAWTAAVVIAAPDPAGTPASNVTLVEFDTPTFPLSLDPVPNGLRPTFSGDGGGSSVADYRDAAGENGFLIYVGDHGSESPDQDATGYQLESAEDVTVDGQDAELVRYSRIWCTGDDGQDCARRAFAALTWERADDVWVRILGDGQYRFPDRLLAVAESLVDRPQPATLRMGLAPDGWSVQFFKMGRVLTLVNDEYEQQTLTVHIPLPEDVAPPEDFNQVMSTVGPVVPVTVHDRPAHMVLLDAGYLDQRIWFLQAQFDDGTVYQLQAPEAFTQQQVVEMAEQVTYNP